MAGKAVTTKKLVIFALGTGLTSILSKLCVRKFENSIPKILENFNKHKQHEDGGDGHKNVTCNVVKTLTFLVNTE